MMAAPPIGMDAGRNGPPPEEAACLYAGTVMHQRLKPFGHRFSYRVFSLMVDLDRLEEAGRLTPLFSVNRFNWISFREKDHLDAGGETLALAARRWFREAGIGEPLARMLLVGYPRVFGVVFNPLAVYYGYGPDGRLLGMIYEVRNTFGGRHRYVLRVDGEGDGQGLRQEVDKIFHVSPFVDMAMRYRFRMLPPGEAVRWRILETDREGPLLSAVFSGTRRALTSSAILALCARIPLLPLTVLGGIHWQALRLWLKGAKFHPDPGKAVTSPDSPQLPNAKFGSRLEQDAVPVRSSA
jgi:DUF1365 family protein